jgi:hypothetical protein
MLSTFSNLHFRSTIYYQCGSEPKNGLCKTVNGQAAYPLNCLSSSVIPMLAGPLVTPLCKVVFCIICTVLCSIPETCFLLVLLVSSHPFGSHYKHWCYSWFLASLLLVFQTCLCIIHCHYLTGGYPPVVSARKFLIWEILSTYPFLDVFANPSLIYKD